MADEPPPPEDDTEETAEHDDEPSLYPFLETVAGGGPRATVRAGWADEDSGEPVELAVNYEGGVGSPAFEAMAESAREWYRETVSSLMQQQQREEQQGGE